MAVAVVLAKLVLRLMAVMMEVFVFVMSSSSPPSSGPY